MARRKRRSSDEIPPCLAWPNVRAIGVFLAAVVAVQALLGGSALAVDDRSKSQGIVDCTQDLLQRNNPGFVSGSDHIVCFQAYISNFDTSTIPVNGKPRHLGVPHWVIQRVDLAENGVAEGRKRPRSWFTLPDLSDQKIAPTDKSYQFSAAFRAQHSNWYERGHLAQKYLAERLPGDAGWFTHNLANAVPQRARFNKGAWLALECMTGAWANEYGHIWIVSGPIFTKDRPTEWLQSDSNKDAVPVAIPDEIFKVVIRQDDSGTPTALAFMYPQDDASYNSRPFDPARWLTSIGRIEELSEEKLLPNLPSASKKEAAGGLWPVTKHNYDPSCRSFAEDIQ